MVFNWCCCVSGTWVYSDGYTNVICFVFTAVWIHELGWLTLFLICVSLASSVISDPYCYCPSTTSLATFIEVVDLLRFSLGFVL